MLLNLNSRSDISERINMKIDAGIQNVHEERRNYLGCSAVETPCERELQYYALGIFCPENAPKIELPARARRIFERGHVMEDLAANWLRLAGFLLVTRDETTQGQFEVSFAGGRLKGHADGILAMWRKPDELSPIELPALWECKCLGHKYVNQARREHIRKSHPKYYVQMQLYMAGLGLKQGLITCIDADTCELYHELIEFNQDCVDRTFEKVDRVFTAIRLGEYLPKGETSPAAVRCKMCRYNTICWEGK